MKIRKCLIAMLVLLLFEGSVLLYAANNSMVKAVTKRPEYVPGELIIKYKNHSPVMTIQKIGATSGNSIIKSYRNHNIEHIKLETGMSVKQAIAICKNDPNIQYAEPNYYRYLSRNPNDPMFSQLWGLHNTGQTIEGIAGTNNCDIDAPEAWDIITGGQGVVVAVIDSGVDVSHPDLQGNIWNNPGEIEGNGVDDDLNGYIDDKYGWNFVDNNNTPIDDNLHGTHVAGIIAAKADNGVGVVGVCWDAKVMALKVADGLGSITSARIISAIQYANANGADIINMSLGSPSYSQAEKDVIDASNSVIVCAAGNDGSNNDSIPFYPASYTSPNIISVAATDQNDQLAWFSNYGSTLVDVAAPGTNIKSTTPGSYIIGGDNFDDGSITGWTTGGINDTWGVSQEYYFSPFYSLAVRPYSNYLNNSNSWIRTPAVDLSGKTNAMILFFLNGETELGYDGIVLEASLDSIAWTNLPVYVFPHGVFDTGISGSTFGYWLLCLSDLSSFTGNNTVYVRVRFESDETINYRGYYIDDCMIFSLEPTYNGSFEYSLNAGTSMAAPYVSGVAALVKSKNPALTNIEIKQIIESNVDQVTGLSGKVASGGRINAFKAVSNADIASPPPSSGGGGGGGGGSCFIATVVYGSPASHQVLALTTVRDEYLLKSVWGRLAVSVYYKIGPQAARFIEHKPESKRLIRGVLEPIVKACDIISMSSE